MSLWKDVTTAFVAFVIVTAASCKQPGCASDTDCKGARVCQSGACVEPTQPTPTTTTSLGLSITSSVVTAPAAPVADQDLVGDYQCSIDTYPAMRCRIMREPSGVLTLDKLEGSQRFHGVVIPIAGGFSFNGAYSSCPDCPNGPSVKTVTCTFAGAAGNFSCTFSPSGEHIALVRSRPAASNTTVDPCPNGRCPCNETYSQHCPGVADDGLPLPHGPFCCLPTMFCGAYFCEDKSHMVAQ